MPSKQTQEQEVELRSIAISLLGGSNSGKTSFFQGIMEVLVNDILVLDMQNGTNISLQPIDVHRGVSPNADSMEVQEETVIKQSAAPANDSDSAMNAFKFLESGGYAGIPAMAANTIGRPAKNAEQVDDRNIESVEAKEKLAESVKLADQLRRMFMITPEDGFQDPTATVRYVNITFYVLVNDEPKCRLTITDYAGELIDNASAKNNSTMVNMLASHINNSDAAIVLANARDLSAHIEDIYDATQCMFKIQPTRGALSADNINAVFRALKKDNFTMLLTLTQKDSPQVDERIRRNHFARAQQDLKTYIFNTSFLTAANKKWSSGVLPVSVIGTKRDGSPNVDQDNQILSDADLHQESIDTAILFCLYNAIMAHMLDINTELTPLKQGIRLFKSKEDKARIHLLEEQQHALETLRTALASNPNLFSPVYEPSFALEVHSETGDVTVKKQTAGQTS